MLLAHAGQSDPQGAIFGLYCSSAASSLTDHSETPRWSSRAETRHRTADKKSSRTNNRCRCFFRLAGHRLTVHRSWQRRCDLARASAEDGPDREYHVHPMPLRLWTKIAVV